MEAPMIIRETAAFLGFLATQAAIVFACSFVVGG
jgi:hypothetical protein